MASMTQSPVSFPGSLASKPTASDLLRSSSNGLCGVPLKVLGRTQIGARRRGFAISAKVRKVKRHEYPWPEDPDLNVKGGVLTHLSPFKPLKEKPKPVTLDFEKPLMDLQKKIIDVQKMANETGLDFSDQIISLENKYQQALKDLYTHLTPIQRVNIARHPNRPTFLDHVFYITEKFVELHGDRARYDDPAVVTGLGTIKLGVEWTIRFLRSYILLELATDSKIHACIRYKVYTVWCNKEAKPVIQHNFHIKVSIQLVLHTTWGSHMQQKFHSN